MLEGWSCEQFDVLVWCPPLFHNVSPPCYHGYRCLSVCCWQTRNSYWGHYLQKIMSPFVYGLACHLFACKECLQFCFTVQYAIFMLCCTKDFVQNVCRRQSRYACWDILSFWFGLPATQGQFFLPTKRVFLEKNCLEWICLTHWHWKLTFMKMGCVVISIFWHEQVPGSNVRQAFCWSHTVNFAPK